MFKNLKSIDGFFNQKIDIVNFSNKKKKYLIITTRYLEKVIQYRNYHF